jgi:pimeloyl-ACP methyl ester carboxylesterase
MDSTLCRARKAPSQRTVGIRLWQKRSNPRESSSVSSKRHGANSSYRPKRYQPEREGRGLTRRCTCRPRGSADRAASALAVRGSLHARPQVSGHPLGGEIVERRVQHLRMRRWGQPGRTAIVLHGGPGSPGSAGPLAQALADPLYVLEPFQRWSSSAPLTVDQHVGDLADVLSQYTPDEKPALVGVSWGAMLALVFACRHPYRVSAVVLVGCGTFDENARAHLQQTLEQRTNPEIRARLANLEATFPDETERFLEAHRVSDPIYTFCRYADANDTIEQFDIKGHFETWSDMLRLQASGSLPAAFASIDCPVLMLHGTYDPHPGAMIRDSLARYVTHLEYHEFEKCGHIPWVEEHARDRFLVTARQWLNTHVP